MWIVRLALRKPYTFTVMAILILIMGVVSFQSMPKDIFPNIDIPVVSVIWGYTGLPPQEMERRFISISERAMTTTVNDIEHQESQSYTGVGVIKVFFQPNVKIEQAVAQVTAISQTLLRIFPPGSTPPLIIQYNASSVPILQLAVSSKTLPEAELFDQSINFIRRPLAGVQGAAIPYPYGGKMRLVSVDLDLKKCQALDISPSQVSDAVRTNWTWVRPKGCSAARCAACHRLVTCHSRRPVLSSGVANAVRRPARPGSWTTGPVSGPGPATAPGPLTEPVRVPGHPWPRR